MYSRRSRMSKEREATMSSKSYRKTRKPLHENIEAHAKQIAELEAAHVKWEEEQREAHEAARKEREESKKESNIGLCPKNIALRIVGAAGSRPYKQQIQDTT